MPAALTSGGPQHGDLGRRGSDTGAGYDVTSPEDKLAIITRDQWQNFLDFYRPIEDEVLKSAMQTDFTSEGDKAGATAASGVNASRGSLARTLSRAGTSLNAEEKSAVNRRHSVALTRSVAQAENTTRRGMSDSRTNLLAGMVGVGRGVSASATSGLNTAAGLETARNMSLTNKRNAAKSTNAQGAATLAAAIIAMY